MKLKVSLDGDSAEMELVLSRKSMVSNVHIQTELNRAIGTTLDVERWAQSEDEKKVYKRCGMMIQKEVVKRGKAFIKLFKAYRVEKKQARSLRKLQTDDAKTDNAADK